MTPRVFNAHNQLSVAQQIIEDHGATSWMGVSRGTPWGNPFIRYGGTETERQKVCEDFEYYAHWRLSYDPHWLDALRGQHLLCVCAPRRCHADTLLRLANLPPQPPYDGMEDDE
jgi:hypothetical protein